jgi:ankyrin repeat protein
VVWVLATKLGADVNEATPQGVAALILAADFDHLDVVQCLVKEFGASIGNEYNYSGTALLVSALSGQYAILRWFLEHTGACW